MRGVGPMDFGENAGTDRFALEIHCADATMLLRGLRGPLALWAPRITGKSDWVIPELPKAAFGERHHRAFLDIVRGKAPPDTTAEDGLATLLVAEAIYRSAESRREERVRRVAEALETP